MSPRALYRPEPSGTAQKHPKAIFSRVLLFLQELLQTSRNLSKLLCPCPWLGQVCWGVVRGWLGGGSGVARGWLGRGSGWLGGGSGVARGWLGVGWLGGGSGLGRGWLGRGSGVARGWLGGGSGVARGWLGEWFWCWRGCSRDKGMVLMFVGSNGLVWVVFLLKSPGWQPRFGFQGF